MHLASIWFTVLSIESYQNWIARFVDKIIIVLYFCHYKVTQPGSPRLMRLKCNIESLYSTVSNLLLHQVMNLLKSIYILSVAEK